MNIELAGTEEVSYLLVKPEELQGFLWSQACLSFGSLAWAG